MVPVCTVRRAIAIICAIISGSASAMCATITSRGTISTAWKPTNTKPWPGLLPNGTALRGPLATGPQGTMGNGPRGPAPGQQRPGLKASDQTGHIRAAAATFRVVPDPIEMTLDDYVETAARRRLPVDDRKALEVLELNATATLQDVKKRYKQLVKRFHPDANGSTNDPDNQSIRAQEELRQVIAAYSHLVKSSHLMNST